MVCKKSGLTNVQMRISHHMLIHNHTEVKVTPLSHDDASHVLKKRENINGLVKKALLQNRISQTALI